MKVQIYVTTVECAEVCLAAGVDFIGVVVDPQKQTPSSLTYSEVREIFQRIPDERMRVSLTLNPDLSEILTMVEEVNPHIVHLAFDLHEYSPSKLIELRRQIPEIKLMLAIPINRNNPIGTALRYQSAADFLILDTKDPNRIEVGASGQTHDWRVSAKLVQKVKIPVILAGGLSPVNVAEAIRTVHPWGVDSFSLTNQSDSVFKDKLKVYVFVENAKSALLFDNNQ